MRPAARSLALKGVRKRCGGFRGWARRKNRLTLSPSAMVEVSRVARSCGTGRKEATATGPSSRCRLRFADVYGARYAHRRYLASDAWDLFGNTAAADVECWRAFSPAARSSSGRVPEWRLRCRRGLPRERRPCCQYLVEHATERPNVTALIDRASPCLFGRHVRQRAEYYT